MIRRIFAVLALAVCPGLALAQVTKITPAGGGGVSSGSAVSGCTAFSIVYIDTSGSLACASTPINGSVTTAGRSILTIRDTITGASATSNFLNITGAFPATLSATTSSIYMLATAASDTDSQNTAYFELGDSGGSANAVMAAVYGKNSQITGGNSLGVGTAPTAGKIGVVGVAPGIGSGSNTGVAGFASGGTFSGAPNVGVKGVAVGTTTTDNIGVWGNGNSSTGAMAGVYATLGSAPTEDITGSAALIADNAAIAANIFEARDNGTPRSTTAAAANVTIQDGAQVYLGPMGLTSSTMTPTIVSEARTVTHSYAWTNAMVAALAGTAGDITVATLPAKTQINNAYVVIDGAAAGPATVTVSCGDAIAGTPFINYIVPSDAKAAANTVYGDAVAERGTSIDVEFYYLPAYAATTLVTCHYISSGANLSTVTGSAGRLVLTTTLLP